MGLDIAIIHDASREEIIDHVQKQMSIMLPFLQVTCEVLDGAIEGEPAGALKGILSHSRSHVGRTLTIACDVIRSCETWKPTP